MRLFGNLVFSVLIGAATLTSAPVQAQSETEPEAHPLFNEGTKKDNFEDRKRKVDMVNAILGGKAKAVLRGTYEDEGDKSSESGK